MHVPNHQKRISQLSQSEQLDLKHKVTSNFRHLEILQPKGFEPPQYANSTYGGASCSSMYLNSAARWTSMGSDSGSCCV
jgi:hypothetical protein